VSGIDNTLLGRRSEVSIVDAIVVLHVHQHAVTTLPTFAKVVGLEVERRFGKAITEGQIMDRIDHIKCVSACSIHIRAFFGPFRGVVLISEDKSTAALLSRFTFFVDEGDDVIASDRTPQK
jgi:hypothetical protein